jgi:deoxyribodipyrimidine photo-lyase
MSDLILFWHRRDLRISDNTGLAAAKQQSPKVVGVFCLDPNILEPDDIAPVKVTYMIGCLQKLQERYAEVGSQLLILHANPVQAIPALAEAINAKAVFWNWDVEPYSQKRDRTVINALKEKGFCQASEKRDLLVQAPSTHPRKLAKVLSLLSD